jgi:hypothetical protein
MRNRDAETSEAMGRAIGLAALGLVILANRLSGLLFWQGLSISTPVLGGTLAQAAAVTLTVLTLTAMGVRGPDHATPTPRGDPAIEPVKSAVVALRRPWAAPGVAGSDRGSAPSTGCGAGVAGPTPLRRGTRETNPQAARYTPQPLGASDGGCLEYAWAILENRSRFTCAPCQRR